MTTAVTHRWILTIAFAQALTLATTAHSTAQETAAPRRNPARAQPQRDAAQTENLDAHFAACLILSNQNEIASARLAEQRTKSPEVKKFAQAMEKDHEKFIAALEEVAGNPFHDRRTTSASSSETRRDARTEDSANDRSAADDADRTGRQAAPAARTGVRKNGTGKGPAAASTPATDIHLQIKQEIADECLASTQRELSSKEGREFDACYIGIQLAAHMLMIDELKVLERHASAALKPVLRQGLETAQEHLSQAKQIMKDIENRETASTTAK